MASVSSLLCEAQFHCSICLDVFREPVSIPCGHTFCKTCITDYWDGNVCQCPLCKRTLHSKPDMFVNVLLAEMAAKFTKSAKKKTVNIQHLQPSNTGEVFCDICTEDRLQALKSCLVCLASYCQIHLEPHGRVASLKRHILINPVENPKDRVCDNHERPLELFCKTDQTCVCQFCTELDHRTHDMVPLEEECRERRDQWRKRRAEIQQIIEDCQKKVSEIIYSAELSKKQAKQEISDTIEVFTALVAYIQASQTELIETIDKEQSAVERRAKYLIEELEKEIADFKERALEVEQLLYHEDLLYLIQRAPSLPVHSSNRDWSDISIQRDQSLGNISMSLVKLRETLGEEMGKLCDEFELKRVQQYAVDVTLDPDTAHPQLILSEDGKEVLIGNGEKNLPVSPKRFSYCFCVLGKQSFSSGRLYYYEIEVNWKTEWDLGVATESAKRKGKIILIPENGYWAISLRDGNRYRACTDPIETLTVKGRPQKVGVLVDYEVHLVSFYDVEARAHIYSFYGCNFTEFLYPYFFPGLKKNDLNSAPLVICSVNNKEQPQL
ncbi:E3 ubiquitin-protein ligase TRIM39-like [Lampris incognitus]|uniref:E3 ubiquitin-protein ligase TRIM39-like n=1 Tax=Lampris incognitus TaxID=2546036 RepID=UPI0024B5E4E0|nr:E3 ubiquitin-protein ligase TRIM39-like [Lampris incognitus]